jgi:hypothetical protein
MSKKGGDISGGGLCRRRRFRRRICCGLGCGGRNGWDACSLDFVYYVRFGDSVHSTHSERARHHHH